MEVAKLYVVYSYWLLDDIRDFLYNLVGKDAITGKPKGRIGPMRVDYDKGRETYRSFVLMDTGVFSAAASAGFTRKVFTYDFKIKPFELRPNNFPEPGYSSNLYIPLPQILPLKDCQARLQQILAQLEEFGLLPAANSTRITCPGDTSARSLFVVFQPPVTIQARTLTRILLHDMEWNLPSFVGKYRIKCLWAKERGH